jgi:hypothetical protein
MERDNKVRDLIFNYLDMLFSRIEYVTEPSGSMIGMVGGEILFGYFPNRHAITFNSKEFRTI